MSLHCRTRSMCRNSFICTGNKLPINEAALHAWLHERARAVYCGTSPPLCSAHQILSLRPSPAVNVTHKTVSLRPENDVFEPSYACTSFFAVRSFPEHSYVRFTTASGSLCKAATRTACFSNGNTVILLSINTLLDRVMHCLQHIKQELLVKKHDNLQLAWQFCSCVFLKTTVGAIWQQWISSWSVCHVHIKPEVKITKWLAGNYINHQLRSFFNVRVTAAIHLGTDNLNTRSNYVLLGPIPVWIG
jgi:hypothetical protein